VESQGNEVTIRLPPEPHSIAQARRFVAQVVSDRISDTHELLLMTGELVTNVVLHVRTDVILAVAVHDGLVRVEVHNGEAATETFRELIARPSPAAARSIGGRGLGIVHALASRVGLVDAPCGGKVVWFEYEERAGHAAGHRA
jgi:anti-sigma regulatory factor (Ser/Thr protein kinase)